MRWHLAKGSLELPFVVFPLVGAVLVVSGCADMTSSALEQDVAQLRQDVNALRVSAQRGRGDADAVAQLEKRTREQSADTARQVTALSTRLEAMSQELGRATARLDDMTRRLEALDRRSSIVSAPAPPTPHPPVIAPAPSPPGGASPSSGPSPWVTPTPPPPGAGRVPSTVTPPAGQVGAPPPAVPPTTRPAPPAPATPPPAATVPPPPPVAAVPPPTPAPQGPARPSTGGASAEESYQAAYLDFSRGRYPLAINGFRDFLRRFPDSPLADSAQYGIGESYYSLATAAQAEGQTDKATRALEQAVQEFRKVAAIYPRGAKVPTALYKEALALADLKQTGLARARLQYLLDHFPQSEEAPLAKERLAALRQ